MYLLHQKSCLPSFFMQKLSSALERDTGQPTTTIVSKASDRRLVLMYAGFVFSASPSGDRIAVYH